MRTRYFLAMSATALLLAGCASSNTNHGSASPSPDLSAPDSDLIKNALSAAPSDVAKHATVKTMDGRVLRKGDNGWVCFPDHAAEPGNSPRCLDQSYQGFMKAYMQKIEPHTGRVGFGYMLQGGKPGSDTNPLANGPQDKGVWQSDPRPPHIMVVVPDTKDLEGLPTDSDEAGPWVMWSGTPYAHIMIPLAVIGDLSEI
ncbi:hypothetical protein [Marinobacter gelidimuriae]|uniref:hypothetical protein n=1 Tax=Marinobacter gelidimuriae TaxID=2739064 RepID=UPI000380B600|nr:hypothetical protein [Marinobacter gelidimuriae]